MIITCEACGTSFKVKSNLIDESGSTVRCSKCQHVFIAYPHSAEDGKPADFTIDESLEAKIDDVMGKEFEEDYSDLESEISLETADIPVATAEELFETAATRRKDREVKADESEILLSDLEQDDNIISMDSLVSQSTAEENLDAWLSEPASESDIISYGELGAKATAEDLSEIVSFDNISRQEAGRAPAARETEEDFIDLGDLESTEPDALEPAGGTEEEVDFLDFEDEAAGQSAEDAEGHEIEMALDENLKDTAELSEIEEAQELQMEEPEIEMKGGVDKDLDAFDLDKGSEDDTSKGTAKKAGKPAQDVSKKEEKEEDFELDFELEPDDAPVEASKATADADEFDFDLDLEDAGSEIKSKAAAADVKKDSAVTDDLGLDLDGFEDLDLAEEPSDGADLDLASVEDLGSSELGMDLDLDKELADIDSGDIAEEDFSLDFDLDEKAEQKAKAKADDDLDLDFDFDADAKEAGLEEESFDLDLSIEPEPVKADAKPDEFDLDLDFDEGLEGDASVPAASGGKGAKRKTEELDLTQIEDVLDFDEKPEPAAAGRRDDLKGLAMEGDETGPFTVSEDEGMSIDLETMLDDEETSGAEKEVSLETVEEREQQIEKTYRKTVVEKQKEPEEVGEDISEEEDYLDKTRTIEKPYAQPAAEGRNLKKILIPVILLIALGAILYAGIKMFGAKEEAPVVPVKPAVTDQGNLRMEMIAEPAYQFVENKTAGEILVVTGNVTNRYDHPRSHVMVKGVLYDGAGKVIVTSSAYAGNMFTQEELAGLDLAAMEARLNNREGDNNANIGAAPGNIIPFTVVFSNLPDNIRELTVEAVSSAK